MNATELPAVQDPGRVYRRLLGYARPHVGMFAVGVFGMALFAATDSAMAYLVQVFLNGAFADPDPRIVWIVPLGAITLFLLRGIAMWTGSGLGMTAPVPPLRKRPLLNMRDMGMDHSAMPGMEGMGDMGMEDEDDDRASSSSRAPQQKPRCKPRGGLGGLGGMLGGIVQPGC